jgi:hypothetical protein
VNLRQRVRVTRHHSRAGGRADRTSSTHPLLVAQRAVGNRAVTLFLQRTPQADGRISDHRELVRTRPVGGAVDIETRVRIIETLRLVPRSKLVIDRIVELRGDVSFPMIWSASGDSHERGTIKLDRTGNETEWVESMSHELVHLSTFLAGRAADVHAMGREEFVTAKMTDEINAHAAAYVTQLQMGKRTSTSVGFDEFVALLRSRHARTLAAEDWTAIEALAKTFVTGKYDHEWVGSRSGENYYDKWRRVWDEAHPQN